MIDKDWGPKDDPELTKKVQELKLQIKPDLPVDEIVRMQLEVLMFASNLTWTIAQARFFEAKKNAEVRSAYTESFLKTEGSDRKRDASAKAASPVRVAESKAFEAEVTRKLLEDYKTDLVAIHYALKTMLAAKTQEVKLGY